MIQFRVSVGWYLYSLYSCTYTVLLGISKLNELIYKFLYVYVVGKGATKSNYRKHSNTILKPTAQIFMFKFLHRMKIFLSKLNPKHLTSF